MTRALLVAGVVLLAVAVATGCDGARTGAQSGAPTSSPTDSPRAATAVAVPSPAGDERNPASGIDGAARVGPAITGGLRPLGRYPFDALVTAGPIRWGDAVLVGTATGEVASMSVHGRGMEWTVEFGLSVSALAAGPRAVYVAEGPRLHALQPRTGRAIWSAELPAPVVTGLTVAESALYAGLSSGEVAAVASGDGSFLWRARIGERPVGRIVAGEAMLYVAGEAGTLAAIDASNGASVWSYAVDSQPAGAPVVRADGIAAVTVTGTVVLLDHDGDGESWSAGISPVLVPPVVHDETIVVADGTGRIRAHASDGSPLWQRDLSAHLAGAPLQAADIVVAADAGGGVVAVDVRTGEEISRLVFESAPAGDAVFHDGLVYWALRDGSVRAIGLDGALGDLPRFTAEGTWAIPESGTFRLSDEQVSLRMRSQRDAVFEIAVASTPARELDVRVETDDGRIIVSNAGWAAAGRVRAVLGAGVSYQLIVGQPSPSRDLIVTVGIEQLR